MITTHDLRGPTTPSSAQLETLYTAASSGDFSFLKELFYTILQSGGIEVFTLANDASVRTGLTALHAAASRGYIDIVRWCAPTTASNVKHFLTGIAVIEECGAMPAL